MIEPALLERAVSRGILTEAQASDLVRLDRDELRNDRPRDDEQLRLVTGFADIFVTIGLVLFLGTLAYIVDDLAGATPGSVLVAVAAWGLAEFFTRRRRMALPSIVLLVVFALASFAALTSVLAGHSHLGGWAPLIGALSQNLDRPLPVAGAALGTLALVTLHYRRFRVPITIAAGTAALAGTLVALAFAAAPELAAANINGLLMLAGLAIFAFAMRYDLSDPHRMTRATDTAFWLHLLAAPLIVHPVLSTLALGTRGGIGSNAALLVLAVVVVLTLVALITDRRAILVAALSYTAIAFGTLIRDAGLANRSLPLSLLTLGVFVLLLSAGWHPLRALLLRALPRGFAARLPHPLVNPPGAR